MKFKTCEDKETYHLSELSEQGHKSTMRRYQRESSHKSHENKKRPKTELTRFESIPHIQSEISLWEIAFAKPHCKPELI
jgi:hypothetical protein